MRLATITNWAYGATVVLALASGATTLLASHALDQERAAVEQRYRLDQASETVAADVNALSNQAREYVISGDPTHLAVYRRDLADLAAVEGRLRKVKDIGAAPDELAALADAIRWADALQGAQGQAIAARERGDEDLARRILFSPEYDRELDRVASDVERFQYRLDQRTDTEVRAAADVSRLWKTTSEIVLGLTGLLFLFVLYFVFKRRVLHPVVRLSDVVNRLAAQDYAVELPQFEQIDEIGDMAQAIRVFRENGLARQRLEAQQEADLAMRSLLSRMTQRMQGCETMPALERVIESFMPQIAPAFAGRLYLLDPRRNVLAETCAWLGPVHSQAEFAPGACWALQRSDVHRPAGTAADISCDHVHADGRKLDTVCLPLIAQRTTLGLLYLEPREAADRAEGDILETYLKIVAENVGLAIGNLRLRDALRDMAMADALTGLANRRQLEAVLDLRLDEAERLGQPISCLMADVDHFKRFNDEYGHEAGDAVLRAMGEVLRTSMRDAGVAFRYGGEEFLLLMPELGPEQALRRAEEVQVKVRALRLSHGGRDLGPITASFGLASAPDHCDYSRLVQAADAALYRAKENGRDRIEVADGRRG